MLPQLGCNSVAANSAGMAKDFMVTKVPDHKKSGRRHRAGDEAEKKNIAPPPDENIATIQAKEWPLTTQVWRFLALSGSFEWYLSLFSANGEVEEGHFKVLIRSEVFRFQNVSEDADSPRLN